MVESVEKLGFFSGYSSEFIVNATMVRHKITAPYPLKSGQDTVRSNRSGTEFQPVDKLLLTAPLGLLAFAFASLLGALLFLPAHLKEFLSKSVESEGKKWASWLIIAGVALYALYVLNARFFH